LAKDSDHLAENGPPRVEQGVKSVRIPIRIVDGSVQLAWGAVLPQMEDCSGDLIVPASAIKDSADLAVLSRDEVIPLLPAGATVLCRLGARHIPPALLQRCKVAKLPEAPYQKAAFVEIVLQDALELRLRGTKHALLTNADCKIPALPGVFTSSLNEAYRRISETFEPTRRSAGGNVFLNVYHRSSEAEPLVSLSTLRDERTGVWDAYLRSTFIAQTPNGKIEIRPGSRTAALDDILRERRVAEWAYLTAYNPGSKVTSDEINKRAHEELRSIVNDRGLTAFEGHGVGSEGPWPPEVSLLVIGLSMDDAQALGRRFGQLAIVVGRARAPATLLAC
jgi:hypothetical protein